MWFCVVNVLTTSFPRENNALICSICRFCYISTQTVANFKPPTWCLWTQWGGGIRDWLQHITGPPMRCLAQDLASVRVSTKFPSSLPSTVGTLCDLRKNSWVYLTCLFNYVFVCIELLLCTKPCPWSRV